MPRAARRAATLVVVVLTLLALSPAAWAAPMAQLATSLSIQAKANGRAVEVYGRLVDVRDRAIKNAPLKVTLNATEVQTVSTNASGDWSASVTIPDSLPAGKHQIVVTYDGADAYKPTANSVAVNIDAPTATEVPSTEPPGLKPTTLTASVPADPQLWGSLVNVTGKLSGPNGESISGAPISVTGSDGIRADCLTNSNGEYSCEIAVPDVKGSVNLQASFDSMQGFAGATATATLQVKVPPSPTAEESVASEEPTPTPSASAPATSVVASAPAAAPSSAVVAAPPTQSNYTPLLIALVGAFAVLGLGVLGLSLMRASRKEPVEQFIDADDADSISLLGDDDSLLSPEPEPARAGRYAAVGTAGHRFGGASRSSNPNAPRRALD